MAKARTEGLHKVSKTLADGSIKTYYYAWRGGPKITDKATGIPLQPKSRAFNIRLQELIYARDAPPPQSEGTIKALIISFKSDPFYFGRLSETTKVEYGRLLDKIEAKFGTLRLRGVDEFGARKQFMDWRNSMKETPRTADACWTMLKRLFAYGIDSQQIRVNPCLGGGRLYASDRADKVWLKPHLDALKAAAPAHVWDACELAIWTGQRESDLLKLKWSNYDGSYITLEQGKSKRYGKAGVVVSIPVHSSLKAILDRLESNRDKSEFILVPTKRKQWTKDGFKTVFHRAKAAAKIVDLHFHDFRGTFVLNMAEAGATVPEIASITGHSLGDVQTILDKYLPKTKALADAAMTKLEASADAARKVAVNRL